MLADLARFQLRRVSPFKGLMIDADVWRDAHEYHRDQIRLHHLALHGWGVIQGLEASLADEENAILISPGVAIDPGGTFIVVSQPYVHRLAMQGPRTILLLLQASEVPTGPNQPVAGDGRGQPTRLIDAYRIHEREQLPAEPHLELARVALDGRGSRLRLPHDPTNPGPNELDLRGRVYLGQAQGFTPPYQARAAQPAPMPPPLPQVAAPRPTAPEPPHISSSSPPAPSAPPLTLAPVQHDGEGWDSHLDGLHYLAHQAGPMVGRPVEVAPPARAATINGADLVYLTGTGELQVSDADVANLQRLLERGAVVIAEGCAAGQRGEGGMLRFARSYNELTLRMGKRLAIVDRGHALLTAYYVFATPPQGAVASTMVLEDGGLLYSTADYGCAWQGGAPQHPLDRSRIRDATDLGVNLALYRSVGRAGR